MSEQKTLEDDEPVSASANESIADKEKRKAGTRVENLKNEFELRLLGDCWNKKAMNGLE